MKSIISVFFICATCLLFFSKCENEITSDDKNEPGIQFISCVDVPCPSPGSIPKIISSSDYLYGYSYKDDILKIEFKFTNTCGSAYEDSTSINGSLIYISLNDTSQWHARCSCLHESTFWYNVVNTSNINLVLDIKSYTSDNFITCVDTVLKL